MEEPGRPTSRVDVTTSRVGGAVVVTVAGEVDGLTTPHLKQALDDVLLDPPATLVLDCTPIAFLASEGMSCLIWAHRSGQGTDAVRIVAAGHVLRNLERLGLTTELAVYPTVTAALRQPGQRPGG